MLLSFLSSKIFIELEEGDNAANKDGENDMDEKNFKITFL